MPLHDQPDFHPDLADLINASVTFWEASAPLKLPSTHCLRLKQVRDIVLKDGYFIVGSTQPESQASKPPRYATHPKQHPNENL